MSLSSQNLDAFVACAQLGHFTQAAKQLHITQSALSQRIRNLETVLETQLFFRDRTGARLTDAGEELLRYCLEKATLELETLARIGRHGNGGAAGDLTGDLRIGGFSSVMRSIILPALAPLVAANPRLRLSVTTKELSELPALLRRGEIDYLVLYDEIVHQDIEIVRLGDEVNVLIERVGYHGDAIFLDHDADDTTTARYLKMIGSRQPYTRRYLDDVYGLIDGVKLGLGRAIVPLHLVKNDPDIRIVNRRRSLSFPINLHFYRRSYPSRLHREILACLRRARNES